MKLYIPEIGDSFILSKDWSFTLHAESRNIGLAALFGYKFNNPLFLFYKASEIPDLRELPTVDLPHIKNYGKISHSCLDYARYDRDCKAAYNSNHDYQLWLKERREHSLKIQETGVKEIQVTLLAGTTLKVDRIYIRKGLKDFSSITFFAEGLGEVEIMRGYGWSKKKSKQKSLRFWVKLSDCNKIEIEDLASQE
jgi:hypothetical protein